MSVVNFFLWILLFVLIAGAVGLLVAAISRQQRPDRCLSAFEGYFVTVERQDGRRWSGILRLTETGFELEYPAGGSADSPQTEASYIHYAVEYDDIQAIYRDVEGLTAAERSRRHADLENRFQPPESRQRQRRFNRFMDNLLDTASELFSSIAGRPQAVAGVEVAGPDATTPGIMRHIVGYAGNRYDPLLERSVGQRVISHLVLDGTVYERVGTLQTYSPDFLALVDVPLPQNGLVTIGGEENEREEAGMKVEKAGGHLQITNLTAYPLLLDTLRMDDKIKELGMVLNPKQKLGLNLEAERVSGCEIRSKIVQNLDLIVPRRRAVIRYRTSAPDMHGLFDVGIALEAKSESDEQEERLRWELRQHPNNAVVAASLARLLYHRGALIEAEDYYQQALSHSRALADGGQRASKELEQLRRHQNHQPQGRA